MPWHFVYTLALLWLAGGGLRFTLLAIPPVLPQLQAALHLTQADVGIVSSLPLLVFALVAIPDAGLIAHFGGLPPDRRIAVDRACTTRAGRHHRGGGAIYHRRCDDSDTLHPHMTRTHGATSERSPFDARALVTVIAWLRPCDALGQALAVLVALAWLQITLPWVPVAAGIGALVVATPLVVWRLTRDWPVGEIEAACNVAFDILVLGWALYFTGGASNPFITLLLVPVALAAAALSTRAIAAITLLAAAVYGVLVFAFVPLPDMPMHGDGFRLHLTGMTINFMIAVLLLAVFVGRTRAALRAQREATRRLRERALRDEGILAIATQAADAAHQLNTPLSTLRTLIPELARGRDDDAALAADIGVMTGEVERCRAILRAMVAYGRGQLAGSEQATTLGRYIDACADRFRVLRPEANVSVCIATPLRERPIRAQPDLAHALLNLMQNALDASQHNQSSVVVLAVAADATRLEFTIADHGRGFPPGHRASLATASSKPDGLGIGLALARATAERLHGELRATHGADGTRVHLWLPLADRA